VIFLIFIFVFREASTLFHGDSDEATPQTVQVAQTDSASQTASTSEPEVYNPEAEAPSSGEEGAPGEFIYIAANPAYPHIYNPSTGQGIFTNIRHPNYLQTITQIVPQPAHGCQNQPPITGNQVGNICNQCHCYFVFYSPIGCHHFRQYFL
jgi:hypothetical protein